MGGNPRRAHDMNALSHIQEELVAAEGEDSPVSPASAPVDVLTLHPGGPKNATDTAPTNTAGSSSARGDGRDGTSEEDSRCTRPGA